MSKKQTPIMPSESESQIPQESKGLTVGTEADVSREAATKIESAEFLAGRKAERERTLAIVESPEAEGRKEMAVHLVLHTNLEPEQAREIMSKAPRPEGGPSLH